MRVHKPAPVVPCALLRNLVVAGVDGSGHSLDRRRGRDRAGHDGLTHGDRWLILGLRFALEAQTVAHTAGADRSEDAT